MRLQQLRQRYPTSRLHAGVHEIELVRTEGAGVPLLLLPGAHGTAEVFYAQLLAWGSKRNMVSITYPELTDPALLADAVASVADALGFDSFDLLGSSYGGYLAQWVAVRHGGRVRRLVVGNSFCDPHPVQSSKQLDNLEAMAAEEIQAQALARIHSGPDGELKSSMQDLVGVQQPATLLRSRMLAVQRAVPVPPLSLDESRLLLVECDNDPLIPPPMRDAIRARYPRAQCCVIAAGGHYPHILQTETYNARVASFLGIP